MDALIFMKDENATEENTCSFAEKIYGVTFIVNAKASDRAKQTAGKFFKDLIGKENIALEEDCV